MSRNSAPNPHPNQPNSEAHPQNQTLTLTLTLTRPADALKEVATKFLEEVQIEEAHLDGVATAL